jgi:plastocyanin
VTTRLALALASLLAAAFVASVACSSTSIEDVTPVAGVTEVRIKDSKFEPRVIAVPVGTEVTWTFDDGSVRHDVTGDGWGSDIESSGTYAHTFDEPGTYDYRCTLHAGMDGRVIVTPY